MDISVHTCIVIINSALRCMGMHGIVIDFTSSGISGETPLLSTSNVWTIGRIIYNNVEVWRMATAMMDLEQAQAQSLLASPYLPRSQNIVFPDQSNLRL